MYSMNIHVYQIKVRGKIFLAEDQQLTELLTLYEQIKEKINTMFNIKKKKNTEEMKAKLSKLYLTKVSRNQRKAQK